MGSLGQSRMLGKCSLAACPLLPTALQGATRTIHWSTAQHQSTAHKGCSILAGSTTPQVVLAHSIWCLYLVPWGLLSLPTHSGSLGATELSTIQIYGPHLQLMQLMGLKARQHPPSSVVHHTGFPYEMLRDAHFCYETAEIGEAEDARISGGNTESWQQ